MTTLSVAGFARLGLAATLGAALMLPAHDAEAGKRHHRHHHHHGGGVLAAGIAGAFFGALATAPRYPAYAAPVYIEPYPVYVEPYPVYVEPQPVYVYPEAHYVSPPATPYPARRPLTDIAPAYQSYGVSKTPFDGPDVITYDETVRGVATASATEPWTQGWLAYCRNRFRSFDDESGTYLGFDGKRHFCVAR
jgi:hypothetical protein